MPRPKTRNAYETLNCRVPPGMVDRISAHAELYKMKVRDVVAQFIEAGLTGTPVTPLDQHAEQVARAAYSRMAEGLKMLATVVQPSRRASARPPAASVAPQADNNGVDVTLQSDGTPAYDTEKYHLGKLCPRGHKWNGMDSSLRTNKGSKCLECEKEGKKRRLEAKRAHAA